MSKKNKQKSSKKSNWLYRLDWIN